VNRIKELYESGRQTIGTFINLGSEVSAECIGIAGMDYFIVDTEHSPFDISEALQCIRSAEIRNVIPFIRIKEVTRSTVLKMLDIGAKGLIIPGLKTVDEVKQLIQFGKYGPIGERGFGPNRCCNYGYDQSLNGGLKAYLEQANESTLFVPQCETKEFLEHIEEIVALEGVDGIFVGPFDLSIALGRPGQFDHPDLVRAFEHVVKVCKAAHKPAFIYANSIEDAKNRLKQGFDSITYRADLDMLIESYRNLLTELR